MIKMIAAEFFGFGSSRVAGHSAGPGGWGTAVGTAWPLETAPLAPRAPFGIVLARARTKPSTYASASASGQIGVAYCTVRQSCPSTVTAETEMHGADTV